MKKTLLALGVTVAGFAAIPAAFAQDQAPTSQQGWYVSAGDQVEVGDLLFEQDDSDLDTQISALTNGSADTDWGSANGIGNIAKVHTAGATWGFCDGHAKWMQRSTQANWTPQSD